MSRIHEVLAGDHARLDALLAASVRADGTIDDVAFTAFRGGLLRHIGIEEKILFPMVRRRRGKSPLEEQLHRDHALFAALLVAPPVRERIAEIASLLRTHNPLEEEAGGFYDIAEELAGDELADIVAGIRAFPDARLAPYSDNATLRRAIEDLRRRRE